ncbi:MAG: hypothetical protein HND47_12425 [Chloroflexi bacterium]|nr:hypothetical protein [Chloroflexota bacterium]
MSTKILLSFLILSGLILPGCASLKQDSFAIYLLAEEIPPTNLTQSDINQLILQDGPVISEADIVSYDESDHIIELTPNAYIRLQHIFPMPVKVEDIPFVVCVEKERIYTGTFMTPASSVSYDGVVIDEPLDKTKRPFKSLWDTPHKKLLQELIQEQISGSWKPWREAIS